MTLQVGQTVTRTPSWTVRLDTENRHYSWQFDSYEGAVKTLFEAKNYLETVGEPLSRARIIHSVRIKVA